MQEELRYILTTPLVLIIWLAYSYYEGVREGYYYHSAMLSMDSTRYNVHWLYTQQRLLVLVLIFCLLEFSFTGVVTMFSFIYMFPLVHDGAYYCKRNDLNSLLYIKRWKADSSTSTAKCEIKYRGRVIMFVCGMALYATTVILTILKYI